jgi:hypothetical protein
MSAAEGGLAGSAGVTGGRRDLGYLWLRGDNAISARFRWHRYHAQS